MVVSATCDERGLTLRQYRTLLKLEDKPLRANVLARALGTSRATLSTATRQLESRGLVQRVAAEEDGRGVTIELTELGRSAVARTEVGLCSLLADLSSEIGLASLQEMLYGLQGAIDNKGAELRTRLLTRSNTRERERGKDERE
jgi:DNA-binding MarR family transcriptional regulator